jgi:magnesium transporter
VIRSLYVENGNVLRQDLSDDEIAACARTGKGLLWVDIGDDSQQARSLLQDAFNAHPLAIEDCFNGRVDTPKVDDYEDYLFIVSQSITYNQPAHMLDIIEIDMFLGRNYVVTSHLGPVEELEAHFDRACANEHLTNRGADMLAQTILDALIDRLLPSVEELDEELDRMEEQVLNRPTREVLPRVLLMRRLTLRLRRSILPQRDVVNRLSRGEFPNLIRREALIFFRDIYDHTVRIEEILDSIRDIADSVLSTYLSAVNNRMNEVMKTLSVVTAIFLPLTLIASIFGTNLDYSTLGVEATHGFLWMLVSMIVITVGMIGFFRHRGWF